MTSIGAQVAPPTTSNEDLIMTISAFIWIVVGAVLIGSMTDLLEQLSAKGAAFRSKMYELGLFIKSRNFPPNLGQRIKSYYATLWQRQGGVDDSEILAQLPASLRTEISLCLNQEIIHKVPLFQNCSVGFINSLASALKTQVFAPGDIIVRQGDIGNEMYFIRSVLIMCFFKMLLVYLTTWSGLAAVKSPSKLATKLFGS